MGRYFEAVWEPVLHQTSAGFSTHRRDASNVLVSSLFISWRSTVRKNFPFSSICLSVYNRMDAWITILFLGLLLSSFSFPFRVSHVWLTGAPSFWKDPLSTYTQGFWGEGDKCKIMFYDILLPGFGVENQWRGRPAGGGETAWLWPLWFLAFLWQWFCCHCCDFIL